MTNPMRRLVDWVMDSDCYINDVPCWMWELGEAIWSLVLWVVSFTAITVATGMLLHLGWNLIRWS